MVHLIFFLIFSLGVFATVPILADSELPPVYQTPAVLFDKDVYTWGDSVRVTVISPTDNLDPNVREVVHSDKDGSLVRIGTNTEPIFQIMNYSLLETGPDTGMFGGSFTLVAVGDNKTGGIGPNDGYLEIDAIHNTFSVDFLIDDSHVSYHLEFTHPSDPTPQHSINNSTNSEFPNAQFRWIESNSPHEGTGMIRVQSPDHNRSPATTERMLTFIFVPREQGKIYLPLMETGEDTGIFEGEIKVSSYDSTTNLVLTPGEAEAVGVYYFEDDTIEPTSNPLKLANSLEPTDSTPQGTRGTEPRFVTDRTAYLSNQELLIHGTSDPGDDLVVLLSHHKYELATYRFVTAGTNGSFDASIAWSDPQNMPSGTYYVQVLRPSDGLETTKDITFTSEDDLLSHKVNLTPKQQLGMGISPQDIVCQRVFHLIFKHDSESPACVTPNTKQKLIERGWTMPQPDVSISDDNWLLERYKNLPEVQAFYAKYDDADVSVRADHLSYFAGNQDNFRVRMDLYFDENHDLKNIDFHCYVARQHKTEIAQEDILSYLKKYECK